MEITGEPKLDIYLYRKLNRYYKTKKGKWKLNTRPTELKYLHIAKASGLTYKQVRTRIDKAVAKGIIEKYRAWDAFNVRKNFYRLRLEKCSKSDTKNGL